MMSKNFLIIYSHPNPESFNSAVKDKVISTLVMGNISYQLIDLYKENYNPVLSLEELKGKMTDEIRNHQQLISAATDIIFLFPVWWFRAPAILEGFIDKTFVPGFGYRFKQIIGKYGLPVPLLREKKVLAIITHGAPALPVKILYVNAVKYRFLLGFLSFCFNLFKCKIVQLWSVPFINEQQRKMYLVRVEKLIQSRMK